SPLDGQIEESFGQQLAALPAQTRRLMQLAAADPSGDPVLVWRAAGRLAIGAGAAGPAAEAGLAEFGARVRFRHPLVRSAAYRSASVQTRQELHGALAEVTDPAVDPDRRAWHRAHAAPGGRWPRRKPGTGLARLTPHSACWPRPRPGRWMNCSGPAATCCAHRSRSPPVMA